jgi:hypothetical protein
MRKNMSYDHNIYVGWYAEFDKSNRKVERGLKKVRFCPTDKKHSAKDKFCSVCGSEIQEKEEMQYTGYPISSHILGENSQEELDWMTGGIVKVQDIENLGDSHAIFPEFLGTDKQIVMAPGYNYYGDITRSDGFVEELVNSEKPTKEWVELIKKVFDTVEVSVKFGIIMEIR